MGLSEVKDLCNEAGALLGRGDAPGALRAAEAALARCAGELGEGHWAHAMCLCAAGWARRESGDQVGAKAAFAAAEARLGALEEVDFERAATVLEQLARFRRESGDQVAARALRQEHADLLGRHLGTDHPRYFHKLVEARGD